MERLSKRLFCHILVEIKIPRGTIKLRIDINNLRGAMSDYDAAIDLDPNNFLAHYNRGTTHENQLLLLDILCHTQLCRELIYQREYLHGTILIQLGKAMRNLR